MNMLIKLLVEACLLLLLFKSTSSRTIYATYNQLGQQVLQYYRVPQYQYSYDVANTWDRSSSFGHRETRTGGNANGQYKVLLPDGRLQVVDYVADESGYRASVTYIQPQDQQPPPPPPPQVHHQVPVHQHHQVPVHHHHQVPIQENHFESTNSIYEDYDEDNVPITRIPRTLRSALKGSLVYDVDHDTIFRSARQDLPSRYRRPNSS